MKRALLICISLLASSSAMGMVIPFGDDNQALYIEAEKHFKEQEFHKARILFEWICLYDIHPERKIRARCKLAATYTRMGYLNAAKIQMKLLLNQNTFKDHQAIGAFGLGLIAFREHELSLAAKYFSQAAELATKPSNIKDARNHYLEVLKKLKPQTKFDDTEETPLVKLKKPTYF